VVEDGILLPSSVVQSGILLAKPSGWFAVGVECGWFVVGVECGWFAVGVECGWFAHRLRTVGIYVGS
jgi:hypothetical protein